MAATLCSHCNLPLTSEEAASGVCPACGKAVAAAQSRGNAATSPQRPGLHVHWGWFVGVMIVLPIGLSLLCDSMLNDGPRSASTSRRGRALEDMLGQRGVEALSGLVFLGMAGWFGYGCLKNATAKGFIVAGVPIVLNVGAVLAAWIAPAVLRANETAWQKNVVAEIRALPFGAPVEKVTEPLTFRNKVLVWDATHSALSQTQALLPPNRLAKNTDPSFTVIVILNTSDKATAAFNSGTPGHTRTLTVGVVDYPEKKIIGSFLVRGDAPGIIVFRGARDTGPIVGDTTSPLKNWIVSGGKQTYAP